MSLISMGVAAAAVISLVVAITRRVSDARLVSDERRSDNFDVGSVSKGWLSEQWARKDV